MHSLRKLKITLIYYAESLIICGKIYQDLRRLQFLKICRYSGTKSHFAYLIHNLKHLQERIFAHLMLFLLNSSAFFGSLHCKHLIFAGFQRNLFTYRTRAIISYNPLLIWNRSWLWTADFIERISTNCL